MLSSEHGYLRTTEEDDAPYFHALYTAGGPRFATLDLKREPILPTLMEVRETLSSNESARSMFFTLEEPGGVVAGFMCLRGLNQESGYCEVAPLMLEEDRVHEGLAAWALSFVLERAFNVLRLRKVTAHALCRESSLRQFLLDHDFTCDGAQREVVHARGRWHDVVCYSRFHPGRMASTEHDACL